jgi:hypothetical protein
MATSVDIYAQINAAATCLREHDHHEVAEALELVVAGANDLPRVTWRHEGERWSRITFTQEGEGI